MKRRALTEVAGAVFLLATLSTPALADTRKARLDGFREVPVVSTTGEGRFKAKISPDKTKIEFELQYSNLEGMAVAAHIHLGQRDVNGSIVIHLCGTGGKPPCPGPNSGIVTGTLTAVDVVDAAAQGISVGELDEVIEAMRKGKTYVNVHSNTFTGGEVRGQIK